MSDDRDADLRVAGLDPDRRDRFTWIDDELDFVHEQRPDGTFVIHVRAKGWRDRQPPAEPEGVSTPPSGR